jgi:hypothetical protein
MEWKTNTWTLISQYNNTAMNNYCKHQHLDKNDSGAYSRFPGHILKELHNIVYGCKQLGEPEQAWV